MNPPAQATGGSPAFAPATLTPQDSATPVDAAHVAQVVDRTFAAAANLRASGHDHVNVAVRLDDGHELTIHLRIANGEVTPVISTHSDALRAALAENWSTFAQRTGDHDFRVSTPVFESPKTSSGMSDLNQGRDQRQRAFESAAEMLPFSTPRPRSASASPTTPTAAIAQTDHVSLYA